MKILVIGGGGREHALAWKISQSPKLTKLYCAPGNAGTTGVAENINIPADDIKSLLNFALSEKIDLTVVGPEVPLVMGIVDLFEENSLRIFGPSKAAAKLEGSKSFMKDIVKLAGIPTASFKEFVELDIALEYLKNTDIFPQVIKADGLAAGKGVLVAEDRESAIQFVKEVMGDKVFGTAGNKIIIEEFLEGEEASYIVACDGKNFVPFATSQDHKRVGDGDTGLNTGGMGAYSPAPIITKPVEEKIKIWVITLLLEEMEARGIPFKGFLYAGLMISNGDPYLLEFNVRFGDPEAQPILSRYNSDLVELLEASIDGEIDKIKPEWHDASSVCVVMASGGYPAKYEKGKVINGLRDNIEDVTVFHAGTKMEGDNVVTNGGRVLGVTANAPSIEEAADLAYKRALKIHWEDCFYRKDIAGKAINRD